MLLGAGNVVKLGDFGLAKYLEAGKDQHVASGSKRFPVRSMAPESLVSNAFSLKTDVWAFGVTMWEVASFGETPYKAEGVTLDKIKDHVLSGKRPPFPTVGVHIFVSVADVSAVGACGGCERQGRRDVVGVAGGGGVVLGCSAAGPPRNGRPSGVPR